MFPSAVAGAGYGDHSMKHRQPGSCSVTAQLAAPPLLGTAGGFLESYFNYGGCPLPAPAISAAAAVAASPPSYSSSLPSYYLQNRSIRSLSLPVRLQIPDTVDPAGLFAGSPSPASCHLPQPMLLSTSPPSSISSDYLELYSGPVRRVYSTGDLQCMNGSPTQGESCGQDGGVFGHKVGRYSAEERKERIERYRHKRHQRNFHKKITYACRKTLADSRPRVKGRFARNGEMEEGETMYSSDYSTNNGNGGMYQSADSSNSEWWRQVFMSAPPVAPAEEDNPFCFLDDDDELLASLSDFSVNLDAAIR